ncbi:MAG: response regulator transcription factor [Acidobacteria bacterium]|nr:response regulator transcription factor [Acidobacteriota bacterium]
MSRTPPKVVAVLNTSDDTVELLRVYLESEGYVVVSAHVSKLKRGELSIDKHIADHGPDAVVFDISPPYDSTWTFLEHLRAHPSMKQRPFVLTSTNVKRVHEVVASSADERLLEIIGKPYDLKEIVAAVKKAVGD